MIFVKVRLEGLGTEQPSKSLQADRSADSDKLESVAKAKKIKKERRRDLPDNKKDNRPDGKETPVEPITEQNPPISDVLSELERKSELLSTAMGGSSTDIFTFLDTMMDSFDEESLKGPVYLHKNSIEAKVIFFEETVL